MPSARSRRSSPLSRIVFTTCALAVLVYSAARTQSGAVGEFEAHGDIGAPKIAGSATYDEKQQQYALSAGGVNMWAQKDEFHFAWKRMTGDFIIQARVELLGQGVDPHRKVGLMVRPSQDADAPSRTTRSSRDSFDTARFASSPSRSSPSSRQASQRTWSSST